MGRDVICGLGGRDVIHARSGADTVFGGAGNDTIFGGGGNDRLYGGGDRDLVRGLGGDDRVFGGPASDFPLTGDFGSDVVNGGAGNEVCVSGMDEIHGNDTVIGGPGIDHYELDTGERTAPPRSWASVSASSAPRRGLGGRIGPRPYPGAHECSRGLLPWRQSRRRTSDRSGHHRQARRGDLPPVPAQGLHRRGRDRHLRGLGVVNPLMIREVFDNALFGPGTGPDAGTCSGARVPTCTRS